MIPACFLPSRDVLQACVAGLRRPQVIALFALTLAFNPAHANPISPFYSSGPDFGGPIVLSDFESYLGRDILADDFRNTTNRFFRPPVVGLEWWGSETTGPFELRLYRVFDVVGSEPQLVPIGETLIQAANGFDIGNGIFGYSTWSIDPDWLVFPTGESYALSIASTEPGWRWALGSPGLGSQSLVGMRSADGVEWSFLDDASNPNFAFQVWTAYVPEPSTGALTAVAGLVFLAIRWRGSRSHRRQ